MKSEVTQAHFDRFVHGALKKQKRISAVALVPKYASISYPNMRRMCAVRAVVQNAPLQMRRGHFLRKAPPNDRELSRDGIISRLTKACSHVV